MTAPLLQGRCEGCGASLQLPPELPTTSCGFCGSTLERTELTGNGPDAVVPFDIDEVEARAIARARVPWWRRPDDLDDSLAEAELHAMYVPFHAFEARSDVDGDARFGFPRGEHDYDWLEAPIRFVFEREAHLVSASHVLVEARANGLEPWDCSASVPPSGEVMAGVQVELPTIDAQRAEGTAMAELEDLAYKAWRDATPGHPVHLPPDAQAPFRPEVEILGARQLWLPVWSVRFELGGLPQVWRINGQTGVVSGSMPTSPMPMLRRLGSVLLWLGGGLAGAMVLLVVVLALVALVGIVLFVAVIAALVSA